LSMRRSGQGAVGGDRFSAVLWRTDGAGLTVGGPCLSGHMEMVDDQEIDEMSGSALLDHVETLAATQRRCEVEILKAAVQHAYLHDPDSRSPALVGQPG